jgi:arylsulfatase A-like enzyme
VGTSGADPSTGVAFNVKVLPASPFHASNRSSAISVCRKMHPRLPLPATIQSSPDGKPSPARSANHRPLMKTILIAFLGFFPLLPSAAEKPNIIVIFTDDHGYADLSCMGIEKDVKTPHIDHMAAEGVRFTDGYVTAPQCCPSRAGLLTGRDQNRFGHLSNGFGPLPLTEITIADRLGKAGYTTGMVGKWHLEPNHNDTGFIKTHNIDDPWKIPPALALKYHPHSRGFHESFFGSLNRYSATYDLDGNRFAQPKSINTKGDRIDRQSDAAMKFIDLHHDKPFFLYLAYFAPHVPLASSKKYLDRFPGEMPERRRYALAMLSAVDEGVGRVMKKLQEYKIDQNTLIFFIGDNGAPLKLTMADDPIQLDGAYWNGSKNTPLNGEKGMLAEGGIRVPYLMRWNGKIPAGQIIRTPVTSLDVAATSAAAAGIERPENFDGLNLLPMLATGSPLADRALTWRFWRQSAIRKGNWKLLKFSDRASYLFDLSNDPGEKTNLLDRNPDIAKQLETQLADWNSKLVGSDPGSPQEYAFYHRYFNLQMPDKPMPAPPANN